MVANHKKRWTVKEYLVFERANEEWHEFLAGEVTQMPRSNQWHSLIEVNTAATIHGQLRENPCEVYAIAMRLKISASDIYTYPDISVACDPQFEDKEQDTLLNPTIIIEMMTPFTENNDRGEKFRHYRKLASLKEYLLIAQNRYQVDHYFRNPDDI
jgi:Uma2 family endonuclease